VRLFRHRSDRIINVARRGFVKTAANFYQTGGYPAQASRGGSSTTSTGKWWTKSFARVSLSIRQSDEPDIGARRAQ
jgi:hypothetical protein